MKKQKNFFIKQQCGGMLIELVMTIALAIVIIPFVFRYQQNAVTRAKNIAIAQQMQDVQVALEKYIIENKKELMLPTGKNITRVKITDLIEYGLPENILQENSENYQLRIVKSVDVNNKSMLQGVILLSNSNISPLRTREIVNLGGGKLGFVQGTNTYGGFGTFHLNSVDVGINQTSGLIGTTNVSRGNTDYLWRLPSDNKKDSMMLSPLNLGEQDIVNTKFINATLGNFNEKLKIGKISANNISFSTRTNINSIFSTDSAIVSGIMTSDSRDMNVKNTFSLSDVGKFSSFVADDLYTTNLTLSGLSIGSDDKPATLKIIQNLDVIMGKISAMYVTVGYTGSVTPRLSVSSKIQDSVNTDFYWDIKSKTANFTDASFPELTRMASLIVRQESVSGTITTTLFGGVSANANATVADFLNALSQIKQKVENKYQSLFLK